MCPGTRPSCSSLPLQHPLGRTAEAPTVPACLPQRCPTPVPPTHHFLGRAAEAAQQRTGAIIVPVYLSLDPKSDKPADLKRVVGASGHPGLVALIGDADGVRGGRSWKGRARPWACVEEAGQGSGPPRAMPQEAPCRIP